MIITDALNHASIIDGIRLCKATRHIYAHADMNELELRLKESQGAKYRVVATDGAFSMDGDIAKLDQVVAPAEKYDALVMIDEAHAAGFLGKTGRGSPEHCGVLGKVDIITGTFGKALGGASGGYVAGRKPVIDWLRQRSRPYLFSNSVPPVVAATTLRVLDLLDSMPDLRQRLADNATYFRGRLQALGFQLVPGQHPIIPVMLGDAPLAVRMADRLLELGVYAIGFAYPVVPLGKARIRTQMSAGHERAHLDRAVEAFATAGRELGVIAN